MTTTPTMIELRLPGFEPTDPKTQRGATRKAAVVRTGVPLTSFGTVEARAVADRWRSDFGYPLHAHLYDFLTQGGYRFDPENGTDREIYNELYDWIAELDGDAR